MQKLPLRQITIELTNRCNLRCRMCSIWQEKKKKDVQLSSIQPILELSRFPVQVALTGGEPFLHPSFEIFYMKIYQAYRKKRVTNIDVSTNATTKRFPIFLQRCRSFLAPLSLSISLDGLPRTHNKQRGSTQAFALMAKNITLARRYAIPIETTYTITPLNYSDILAAYEFTNRMKIPFLMKIAELDNPRYYHRHTPVTYLRWTPEKKKKALSQIQRVSHAQSQEERSFNACAIDMVMRHLSMGTGNAIRTCSTPAQSLFITHDGKIYSCLYAPPIGSLKDSRVKIDMQRFKRVETRGRNGTCPKCLAYHGFLKEYNLKEMIRITRKNLMRRAETA